MDPRTQLSISNAGVAVSQTIAELSYTDFEWLMTINSWVRHMAPTRTNPEQTAKVIVDGVKAKRRRILIASDARLLDWIQRGCRLPTPRPWPNSCARIEPQQANNF